MKHFLKILKIICLAFLLISCAITVALALFTAYNVAMRYLFGRPNSGITEWSQMLLIISMACLGYTFLDGRAIRVGVVVDTFPKRLNIAFEVIMGLISFAFCVLVGWRLFVRIDISMKFGESFLVTGAPRWPMLAGLGASFFSGALGTVSFVISKVSSFKEPKEKDILRDNPDLAFLAYTEAVEDVEDL